MSNLQTAPTAANIEQVLMQGDLSKLNSQERISYINSVCQSLGLNPLTRPFEYQNFNGKVILYTRKDATEQLRKIHGVSVYKLEKEVVDGLCTVTAYARDKFGKEDSDVGVVDLTGLRGEKLANAVMKTVTKAKRRVTLSICGLGILDETEIETMREASPAKAEQVNALLSESHVAEQPCAQEPDFLTEAAATQPLLKDYVIPIGQKNKGKKLSDLSRENLFTFVDWVELNIPNKNPATVEFLAHARAYLEETE